MNDLISRQEEIYAVNTALFPKINTAKDAERALRNLPSAQPEVLACGEGVLKAQPDLPEWAQKVEEYRKSAPSHIHNPLAWALYQTWKEYDR